MKKWTVEFYDKNGDLITGKLSSRELGVAVVILDYLGAEYDLRFDGQLVEKENIT